MEKRKTLFSPLYAVRRVSRKTYTDKHNTHIHTTRYTFRYGWIVGGMDIYCNEIYTFTPGKRVRELQCDVSVEEKKKQCKKKAIPSYNPVNDRAIFYLLLQLSRSVYIKYTWEACTNSPPHTHTHTQYMAEVL